MLYTALHGTSTTAIQCAHARKVLVQSRSELPRLVAAEGPLKNLMKSQDAIV